VLVAGLLSVTMRAFLAVSRGRTKSFGGLVVEESGGLMVEGEVVSFAWGAGFDRVRAMLICSCD